MAKRLCLCFGLILCCIMVGSEIKPLPDQILLNTIQQLHGKVELVNYHYGSRVTDWMLAEQVDSFAWKLANDLNCLSVQKRQDHFGVHYQAERKDANWTTRLHVLNDQPHHALAKPYVSIQIRGSDTDVSSSVYRRLKHLLVKYHFPPNIHFTLQGRIPSIQGSIRQVIAQAFQLLHAKEVEGIYTEQFISSSAISRILPDRGLKTQHGKMNVQAALKMNREKNQFLFTIGSPIITIEY